MRRCVRLQAAGATSSSPSALSPGSSTAVRGPVRSAVGATASFLTTRWGAATTSAAGAARATGFALISKYLQCSYPEALAAVEKFCGIVVHSPSSVQESAEQIEPQADLNPDPISKARAAMLALWSEAHPVEQGDPVWNYLLSRGLDPRSAHPEIRTHEGLEYVEQVEDDAAGEHGDDGEEGAEQGKGLRGAHAAGDALAPYGRRRRRHQSAPHLS